MLNLPTDVQSMLFVDCDVASVKQSMEIRPQENAIRYVMRPFVRIRSNVRRLQYRQGAFATYGTSSLVGVSDEYPECPLTDSCASEVFGAIPCSIRNEVGVSHRGSTS